MSPGADLQAELDGAPRGAVQAERGNGPGPALPQAAPRRPRGRPRKTPDERDDGNRRQELIRAAAKLFRTRGFAASSTRDIAAAVGMQSGSPFYHFKSKSALLCEVMEQGMRSALQRQAVTLQALPSRPRQAGHPTAASHAGAETPCASSALPGRDVEADATAACAALRALIRSHFDILLGPDSDFIPVMLYEWRSLNARQRADITELQRRYEAAWLPVLQTLHRAHRLRADVRIASLLLLGALNWSVQWYDADQRASLDELTDAAMALFIHPSSN